MPREQSAFVVVSKEWINTAVQHLVNRGQESRSARCFNWRSISYCLVCGFWKLWGLPIRSVVQASTSQMASFRFCLVSMHLESL